MPLSAIHTPRGDGSCVSGNSVRGVRAHDVGVYINPSVTRYFEPHSLKIRNNRMRAWTSSSRMQHLSPLAATMLSTEASRKFWTLDGYSEKCILRFARIVFPN